MKSSLVVALTVLVIFAVAGLLIAFLLTSGSRGADVTVTTTPERASVWIDGHYLGTTPLTREDLPPGTHVLRVTKFSHRPLLREVTLQGGPNDVRLDLVELVGGTLSIVSNPPGAEAVVDGEPRGLTPVVLKGLSPGGHPVRVSLVNYFDWSGTVDIAEGQKAEVKAALQLRTEGQYLEAIKLKPRDPALWCDLAHYYILRSEWTKAEDALAQTLVLVAPGAEGSHYYSRVMGGNGEVDKIFRTQFKYDDVPRGREAVVNAFSKALKTSPTLTSYYSMGVGYALDCNLPEKAREMVEGGIVALPYDTNWAVQTSRQRFGEGNVERYIERLDAQLKREPNDFVARFQRGVLLRQKGQNDLAVADYEAAARGAKSPAAKARLLEEAGRLHDALKNFSKAAELWAAAAKVEPTPKNRAPIYLKLARVLGQLNRVDEAQAAWKDAVDSQEDVEAACRSRIDWAKFNIAAGKPDRARPVLNDVLKLTGDDRTRADAKQLLDSLK